MGVDLHRIGTGISSGTSRNGFNSIVSFPSVAPSFPAYGTFNSWLYDVTYPIDNGGASVIPQSTSYPSQFCDVQLMNDGAGGTYTDWSTATDIQYFAYGTYIDTFYTDANVNIGTSCNGSLTFSNGNVWTAYNHDGSGGSYSVASGSNYNPYGYQFYNETCTYDDGMGGTYDQSYYYYSDGNGGVYTA